MERVVARLGGMVAPILNQGDMAGLVAGMPDLCDKVPAPCAGSSTSWGQAYLYTAAVMGRRGVALGSDVNGAAGLPGPRFGTLAAYGARDDDPARIAQRRAEIDRQTNGVAYAEPLKDYRWFRFEDSGSGAYDEDERHIWQAIAEYKAGFNPWDKQHPAGDRPDDTVLARLDLVEWQHDQSQVDNIALGLWAADDPDDWEREQIAAWPTEQRAGYFARLDVVEPGPGVTPAVLALAGKIDRIWHKWHDMEGDNPPLVRCAAGPRRDYDINLDGMAHYGLLPDFLQDLRNSGLSPDDLAPLFGGANDYVEVWAKCVARGRKRSGPRLHRFSAALLPSS